MQDRIRGNTIKGDGENKIVFFKGGGHNHDGVSSTLIDSTKYSIFDFNFDLTGNDVSRVRSQVKNKTQLQNYIIETVNNASIAPSGVKLQVNSITPELLTADFILVDQTISSNGYIANSVDSANASGWAIYSNGFAEFQNVLVRGTIQANTGSIGGFTISGNVLYTGSGSSYIALDGNSSSNAYVIYIGNSTPASAPFSIRSNGYLYANSGRIGGFDVDSDSLTSTYNLAGGYSSIYLNSNTTNANKSIGMSSFISNAGRIYRTDVYLATNSNYSYGGYLSSDTLTNTASHIYSLTGFGQSSITLYANTIANVTQSYTQIYAVTGGASGIDMFSSVNNSRLTMDAYGNISTNYYSFANDANTKITITPYRGATQGIYLIDNYPQSIPGYFPYTLIDFGAISLSGGLYTGNGSDVGPSYTFVSDSDTGMYRKGANQLGFSTSGTERLFISTTQISGSLDLNMSSTIFTSSNFLVASATTKNPQVGIGNAASGGSGVNDGIKINDGVLFAVRYQNRLMALNRQGNDGVLVDLAQDGTIEGNISVSGTTVSFNSFAGGHWSQLKDHVTADIPRGTIMETIDEMCDWGTEDNEQLPKTKVSDTVSSKRVYGVFMNWHTDDEIYPEDFTVIGLGAYIVRIDSSEVVSAGDLIESNGNGCGRVQSDDLIKSSTVAKITSPVRVETYPDGSYTVPCVLYCG